VTARTGNLADGFEEVIRNAAAAAGLATGHDVGYVWTHAMVPTQNGGAAFGMVVEVSIPSPDLRVPRLTHAMIVDTATPKEEELKAAVTQAVTRVADTYRKILNLSNLKPM
jgi:hypothetical protein